MRPFNPTSTLHSRGRPLRRNRAQPKRSRWGDIARRSTLVAIGAVVVTGGLWAANRWHAAGGSEWMVNVSITTEVLPYGEDTRLLVVHVHSRNPSDSPIELHKPDDAFQVLISEVPDDLEPGDLVGVDNGNEVATDDLLPDGGYQFIARAELDDVTAVVVPAGANYVVKAEIASSHDYVSATTIVFVPGLRADDHPSVSRTLHTARHAPLHVALHVLPRQP